MGRTGRVILVGAGPGDPGLLTLKGRDAIGDADVLIYDRLVSLRLLEHARFECEFIYVGKTPQRHTLPQDEINALLVEKAKEGKLVVRLKGGDPFVFGRGSEEVLALRENGIDVEIIPGVTSAIAAPEYAGIPVTDRNLASSFSVITGHEDPEKNESSIDWPSLAKQQGTLVFLMGMKNLPTIASNLMANGMSPQTPVAVVYRETWPDQRVLCDTLETVADEVEKQEFTNPSVIVVGNVVSLRQDLAWLDEAPLAGRTIVVTRARNQASGLTAMLESLGSSVEEYPMIRIVPPEDTHCFETALEDIDSFDWVVFSSTNGVEMFFRMLRKLGLESKLETLSGKAVAVGPSTEKELEKYGVENVLVPESFDAEGVVKCLDGKVLSGQKALLVQAKDARSVLRDGIAALGARVVSIAAYRTVPVEEGRDSLVASLRSGRVDAITFTSSSTVRNMVNLLGSDASLLGHAALYSIGPVTSDTMRGLGLEPKGQAESSTIDDLVRLIRKDLGGLS